MTFVDPHVSVTQTDDYLWRLDRHLFYDDPDDGRMGVRRGYVTDFASVPRAIWWLVPTYGNYTPAAVLHDFLITHMIPAGAFSSRRVDRIFREAMRSLGVSFPRRWLMWAGVRWGALLNPTRRRGSLATLPGVLLVSLLALPLVLPALAVLPSLLVFALLERLLPGRTARD
ncbi:DUF1353 domain-containing protein [Prauserella muralis]|uniref:Uncharacterized protein n=1 Tax=Prauserella muralis TaxID=588067 RepID=A0A2V4AKW9_9PSEU|nr:DUF1353 domain-containing protein [Prauserella muralis]PXY20852.1 hypothetical protein BAY60_25445 [Prauserella muralis]TWE29889.1 uncharacterized protein DUF1353 [Prauserella muralis]